MKEYIKLKRRIVYRGDVYNAIEGERINVLPKVFDSEYMNGIHDGLKKALSTLANDVKDIPAADVVEVVRCKDCKWYQLDPWGYKIQCEKIYDVSDGDLDAFYFRPSPEHFCAYGERKEV